MNLNWRDAIILTWYGLAVLFSFVTLGILIMWFLERR